MKTIAFWIASGGYHAEAARSAASLLRYTSLPTCLITPNEPGDLPFHFDAVLDVSAVARVGDPWYLNSVRFWDHGVRTRFLLGADAALYLDTDVTVTADLSPVLALLDRFDFVGSHATGRQTRPSTVGVPDAFPEMAVGMNAFRLGEHVTQLIDAWEHIYCENVVTFDNNDQGPLRDALWMHPEVSTCFLTDEWHWQFRFGGRIRGTVAAFHGRSPNLQAIIARVNKPGQTHRLRVYGKKELT